MKTRRTAVGGEGRVTVGQGSIVAFDGDRWYDPIVVTLETGDRSRSWRRAEVGPALDVADEVIARHEPVVVHLRDPDRFADAGRAARGTTAERRLRRAARRVGAELSVDDGSEPSSVDDGSEPPEEP